MNQPAPSRATRSTPSAPRPARRSHSARTRSGVSSAPGRSGSSTKSFSVPCPLTNLTRPMLRARMTPEQRYQQVVEGLAGRGARAATMFGMPSVKDAAGKAFAGLRGEDLVCRLGRDTAAHAQALALTGAHLFDPSGMGRPMKDWVCIPVAHAAHWADF